MSNIHDATTEIGDHSSRTHFEHEIGAVQGVFGLGALLDPTVIEEPLDAFAPFR